MRPGAEMDVAEAGEGGKEEGWPVREWGRTDCGGQNGRMAHILNLKEEEDDGDEEEETHT